MAEVRSLFTNVLEELPDKSSWHTRTLVCGGTKGTETALLASSWARQKYRIGAVGDQRGRAPVRDRGFGWLRPPPTNFLDSETGELTRLRHELLVHDPGRGEA